MKTPVSDFMRHYAGQKITRLHMPGHKGREFLGCEPFDLTEVAGADELYDPKGIIAESEEHAGDLFGAGMTLYGTEGSSQCIRAMLYLLAMYGRIKARDEERIIQDEGTQVRAGRAAAPVILAPRNVHKSFIYAAALSDIEIEWLRPEDDPVAYTRTDTNAVTSVCTSICSSHVTPDQVDRCLKKCETPPVAVYVTSPDYLGAELDIRGLSKVCHRHGTLLVVDNAHGAYLHFLNPGRHPMDLGADLCCDSAHKTLPVLTGGAYLHIGDAAPQFFRTHARWAMAVHGSTSPSYLTLASLDLCNAYLADGYPKKLQVMTESIKLLKKELEDAGWQVADTDELKLTVRAPEGLSGMDLAGRLRLGGAECEYADPDHLVLMFTLENDIRDLECVKKALGKNQRKMTCCNVSPGNRARNDKQMRENARPPYRKVMSMREAVFTCQEMVPVGESVGRICGLPAVSCPPAIPVVMPGEEIDAHALEIFAHYGIRDVLVVADTMIPG